MSSAAAKTRWFTELLDAGSLSADSVGAKASELKQLDQWFLETLSAMNDADLEFYPCLPEDEAPVKMRIRALGDFCSGFTYGIGIANAARGSKPLPDDTQEIIEDFQAIDAADVNDTSGTSNAQSESDTNKEELMYHELLEYVRVGVLLILEELRPISPAAQELSS